MKMMVACFTQKARFRGHDEVRLGDEEGEQYTLYLHRGAFETALEDEDKELDPDRWCSHSAWGQETWQIVAQWTWNLRLELGHQLAPEPVRTTNLRLPSQSNSPARPRLRPGHHLRDMLLRPPRRPGKLVVLPEPTFPFNLMGPYDVQQATPWFPMSDVESVMGAYGSSILPVFTLAVRVRCGSNANGAGAPRPNRVR